jgi:hypothetical protein
VGKKGQMMTKEQVLNRIDQLLKETDSGRDANATQVLTGALTLMTAAYGGGSSSTQVKALLDRREEIYSQKTGHEGMWDYTMIMAVRGALTNLRQEVESGLLTSLEHRVASDVLSDLLRLARVALDEATDGAKNVAAVLAAAAYEDTIRRIAKEHADVIERDKLDAIIDRLKNAGLLVSPQLGIALSYLSFRNHALHAEWDKIDRASVTSVLGFVQELLLKHFS